MSCPSAGALFSKAVKYVKCAYEFDRFTKKNLVNQSNVTSNNSTCASSPQNTAWQNKGEETVALDSGVKFKEMPRKYRNQAIQ